MVPAGPDARPTRRDDRRARLFATASLGMLAMTPAFYGLGWMQGGWRAQLVAVMGTLAGGSFLGGYLLARAGRLSAAVHAISLTMIGVVAVGMSIAGRIGPVAVFYVGILCMGVFHRRPRDIALLYAMTTGTLVLTATRLPGLEPVYVPTLVCVLTLVGLVLGFAARVTDADMADLRDANLALDDARKQADSANHAKSVFLATMSHELRTPLNAVIGYAEMLRQGLADGDLDPREADEDLARVEAAGRQLLALVGSVLDISRVESGQLVLNVRDVPVRPLLEVCAAGASPRAGVAVHVECALPTGSCAHTDAAVVAQVLGQLVANASRFTHAGSITLRAEARPDGGIALSVQDTGIGIAGADRERIFELFTQIDGSFTRTVDGAGLGLALSKRLAARLGGTLTVESEVGRGSTFTLVLPRSPPDA